MEPIVVDGKSFALNGKGVSYRFHVDEESGDLHADHFGAPVAEDPPNSFPARRQGWSIKSTFRREFPDVGTGDFRSPAVSIKHEEGHTVTNFRYKSHKVVDGKPDSAPLPGTFGSQDKVKTLVIHLVDKLSSVEVDLSYSIFPQYDAIVRNVKVTNNGKKAVTVNKLTSLTVDLPYGEYEYLGLRGEWSREASKIRRGVEYGTQGFGSSSGYSSHHHNPFISLVSPRTTESAGDAWGFSLIYTGSFSAEVDKNSRGMVRASIGMHPDQLSWPLGPGESLTTPECVAVFSDSGIGSMSRKLHGLYRKHLIRSKFVDEPRPALLNSWEGLYFNFDEDSLERLAKSAAHLGAKLFVLDDGWFGDKKPRLNDHAGLGDWMPNPRRFPNGLKSIADKVNKLQPAGSQDKLKFGIWVEPEMVNPESELYQAHPDWVLHAGNYPRSECRQQLVLNLALKEVQDYIIHFMSDLLNNASIGYIKWDNNRGMHEVPSPSTFHAYMLGLYRVLDTLTTRFPDVLWEGCASGGGRFDPGILQYFPQSWTSDNMDAIDRINIQFGTSLVYPASSMGAHIGACPSHVTGRYQSIEFRAHVAMMGGSFGVELDPDAISEEERNQLPELIKLSEKLNPTIITGDLYRLRLPEESQHPAAMYVSEDGGKAVLFVFQMLHTPVHEIPVIRLQGLDPSARYKLDGEQTYSGATLMNGGIRYELKGDYKSKIVFIDRV